MRFVAAMVLASVLALSGTGFAAKAPACGVEYWPIKILTDPAAAQINWAPKAATVEQLVALPVPGPVPANRKRFKQELQTYTVSATLVGFKLETDKDFHVVIAGTSRATTMIVEFPDPSCTGSLKHAEMAKARSDFVAKFGQPVPQFHRVQAGMPITVTGVLFFDKIHGQTGVAKNGVELHPVVDLK